MLHAVQISTVLISHNTFKNHRMKVELFPFYGEKRWGSEKLNHHVNVRKLVSGRQSISLQSPPSFTCEAIWMYLVHGKKKKKHQDVFPIAITPLQFCSSAVQTYGCEAAHSSRLLPTIHTDAYTNSKDLTWKRTQIKSFELG